MSERDFFTAFVSAERKEKVKEDLNKSGAENVREINGPTDFSAYHPGLSKGHGLSGECDRTRTEHVRQVLQGANAYLIDIRPKRR